MFWTYSYIVFIYMCLFIIPILLAVKIEKVLRIKNTKRISNKKYIRFFFGYDVVNEYGVSSDTGRRYRTEVLSISLFSLIYQIVFYGLFLLFLILIVCDMIFDSETIRNVILIIGAINIFGNLPLMFYLIYEKDFSNKK